MKTKKILFLIITLGIAALFWAHKKGYIKHGKENLEDIAEDYEEDCK